MTLSKDVSRSLSFSLSLSVSLHTPASMHADRYPQVSGSLQPLRSSRPARGRPHAPPHGYARPEFELVAEDSRTLVNNLLFRSLALSLSASPRRRKPRMESTPTPFPRRVAVRSLARSIRLAWPKQLARLARAGCPAHRPPGCLASTIPLQIQLASAESSLLASHTIRRASQPARQQTSQPVGLPVG